MGIFSRLTDIINSNINVTLDRAEDPEKIIRLMIQEMEETLVEVRSTAARSIADKKEVQRRLNRIHLARDEWQRKAELALSKNREDLTKGALLEKAKLVATAQQLAEELEQLDIGLGKFEEDIAKLEAKLREVRVKQKAIKARQQTASSQLKVRKQLFDSRIDDAFVRFEQMERRVDAAEGQVESFDLGRGKTLAEEINELEGEVAIEQELSAMKARLRKDHD